MRTVFIPTHNRSTIQTSSELIERMGFQVKFLVHDKSQLAQYKKAVSSTIEVINTDTPGKGRSAQINYVCKNTKEGEYILFAEDDIKSFYTVKSPHRQKMPLSEHYTLKGIRKFFTYDVQQAADTIGETIHKAESGGYLLYGLSKVNNIMFTYNLKRYSENILVNGGFFGLKNGSWCTMKMDIWDDVELSLRALSVGNTLIDNSIKADNAIYIQGGHESGSARIERDRQGMELLLSLFPDTFTAEPKYSSGQYVGYRIKLNKRRMEDLRSGAVQLRFDFTGEKHDQEK